MLKSKNLLIKNNNGMMAMMMKTDQCNKADGLFQIIASGGHCKSQVVRRRMQKQKRKSVGEPSKKRQPVLVQLKTEVQQQLTVIASTLECADATKANRQQQKNKHQAAQAKIK